MTVPPIPESTAAPSLGPLELTVQRILWRSTAPLTAREVMAALDSPTAGPPAYTTVATVLEHLWEKGMAQRARIGRSWSYEPRMTGCQFSALQMAQALEQTPDELRCLSRFVEALTPQNRERLAGLLDGSIPVSYTHLTLPTILLV